MPLLPAALWTALFLSLLDGERTAREAALAAFTGVVLSMLAVTQILSLLHALAFGWLVLCWAGLVALTVLGLRVHIIRGLKVARERVAAWRWTGWDRTVAAILFVFGAGTLLSALLYPIVNFDSLTCHAVRVLFWFQNESVAHYPTAFGPQLFEGPLGAYEILTLKILSGGGDRLANLVQWCSYLFSIVAVSLIALRLGASVRGQQVAAVAAATVPMAVLQASTTQNDLNCAVWSLTAVYGVITYVRCRQDVSAKAWMTWTGAALGLALLAKPLGYAFTFAFFLWLAIVVVRREGWARAGALAAVVVLVALSVNAAWYVGNARLLGGGDVIGMSAPGVPQAVSRRHDPRSILTTALKNGSMQLGTPLPAVNARTAAAVRSVIQAYGGEVEDPLTKEAAEQSYRIDERITNHDIGPSPLTVALIVFAAALVLASARIRSGTLPYLLCAGVAGFLPSGLVGWNVPINRLLLGSLLLFTPVIGLAAATAFEHRNRVLRFAIAALLGLSLGWAGIVLVFNSTNRLVPPSFAPFPVGKRDLGYWNTTYDDLRFRVMAPHLERQYKTVAGAIDAAGVSRVGLNVRTPLGWFPIYPLLTVLPDKKVGYVRDTLFPDRIDSTGFDPEVIVEIVPSEEYPRLLYDGRARGPELIPPQHAPEHVLLLYHAP